MISFNQEVQWLKRSYQTKPLPSETLSIVKETWKNMHVTDTYFEEHNQNKPNKTCTGPDKIFTGFECLC